MRSFKDTEGREWLVCVNVANVRAVKALVGPNLYELAGGESLNSLRDPITLCDVLFVVCREQCEKRGVSSEDFARALGGDALGDAQDALIDGLIDFFPRAPMREALRKAVASAKALETTAVQTVLTRIENGELESEISRAMQSGSQPRLNESSTSAPGSLESTPVHSPLPT